MSAEPIQTTSSILTATCALCSCELTWRDYAYYGPDTPHCKHCATRLDRLRLKGRSIDPPKPRRPKPPRGLPWGAQSVAAARQRREARNNRRRAA